MTITILDYGLGNIQSLYSAIKSFNNDVVVDSFGDNVHNSNLLVLPGVASFGAGINNLIKLNLFNEIQEYFVSQKPILGICLGAQMLLNKSEESSGVVGLSLVEGNNSSFRNSTSLKPNQGWSKLAFSSHNNNFNKFNNQYFYFSHSYVMNLSDESSVIARSINNKEEFTAIFKFNNIAGLQFHPERSGKIGIELLQFLIDDLRKEF